MEFYLHTKNIREDGTSDSFASQKVPHKIKEIRGYMSLSLPAAGYGSRLPTRYMVQVNGKWRRVYCRIFSNSGTLFIGKKYDSSAIIRDYA